jgi:trimethylamine--corrinoid protein Co-methyltransferase
MLQRAFWGDTRFGLSGSISVFDMRTMIYPYGRPEMALTNMALAQMARHYGLPFRGHAGLTDAKLPSCEVGAQKALTAIPTLLAAGHVHIDAGLLSIDEVCSPLQMILDHEFIGALNQLGAEYGITDEDLALDLIEEVGPGGHFIATEHTARHFRQHWEPRIWSRHMLGAWRETGARLDVDHAAEMYNDLHLEMESFITPEEEAALLAIIRRAGQEPALHG